VALVREGAAGGGVAAGVAVASKETALSPLPFTAVTTKKYGVPFKSPAITLGSWHPRSWWRPS